MLKIILKTYSKTIKDRKRMMALTQCPDCDKEQEVRLDSTKASQTTCCRSCLNRRREKTAEFSQQDHYHTVQGRCTAIYNGQKTRSIKYGRAAPTYTREELQEWVEQQPNCSQVFLDWEINNFAKDYSPSIDRLDDYQPYTFSNIRLVPWHENNTKGRIDKKSGLNTKGCCGVRQLSLSGVFIEEFHSLMEAQRCTTIHSGSIHRACSKPNRTAGGFRWEFN